MHFPTLRYYVDQRFLKRVCSQDTLVCVYKSFKTIKSSRCLSITRNSKWKVVELLSYELHVPYHSLSFVKEIDWLMSTLLYPSARMFRVDFCSSIYIWKFSSQQIVKGEGLSSMDTLIFGAICSRRFMLGIFWLILIFPSGLLECLEWFEYFLKFLLFWGEIKLEYWDFGRLHIVRGLTFFSKQVKWSAYHGIHVLPHY